MDDRKVRDYVAAVIVIRDFYGSLDAVTAERVEDILREFEIGPNDRDIALDVAKTHRDRGAARRKVDELFPFLRGRDEGSHALPVIMPNPGEERAVMLTFIRGLSSFNRRIEESLDGLGIKKGETFSITIRRVS